MSDRVVLEVTPDQRRQLKSLAACSGMTMKTFILSRTLGNARMRTKNRKQDDTDLLLANPAMGRRVQSAMSEKRTKRRAFKNLGEVRHALGVRE